MLVGGVDEASFRVLTLDKIIRGDEYLKLIDLGKKFSAEDTIDGLLEYVLVEAKALSMAEAGIIYLN